MRLLKRNWSQVIGMLLVACVLPSCSDDKGVEPKPPDEYAVYFLENYYETDNWFFRYVPATNQLDSTYLSYGYGFRISADGTKMYIRDVNEGDIDILSLPGFHKIGQLPFHNILAVSPDNRYLAVSDSSLYIIETESYSIVFDTVMWGSHLTFAADSRSIYIADYYDLYHIPFLQQPSTIDEHSVPYGVITEIAISPGEDQAYFYVKIPDAGFNCFFIVLDLSSDTVLFEQYLTPGIGDIQVTPNGQFVLFTNPGSLDSPPGDPFVTVYSVERNQVVDQISSVGVLDEPYASGMVLWQMCVTPDGEWLVVLPAKSYPAVLAASMRIRKFVNFQVFSQHWNEGLTCQNGL